MAKRARSLLLRRRSHQWSEATSLELLAQSSCRALSLAWGHQGHDRSKRIGAMISPQVRRALHDALDLVLDALNEQEPPKRRRRRSRTKKVHMMPAGVDEVTLERARRAANRAGY